MSGWSLIAWAFPFVTVVGGCSSPKDCVVSCAEDAECPDGQGCTAAGRCSADDTCPCTPGAFLTCADEDTAAVCAADGRTVQVEGCESHGCNAPASRCNACTPGEASCAGLDLALCGAEGLVTDTVDCVLPCVDDAAGSRCGRIVPKWLGEVCNTTAVAPSLDYPAIATIDTSLDTSCTAIVPQTNGPEICVVRAQAIMLSSSLKIVGQRPIAFVADERLHVPSTGRLDVSADGGTSGPGGGFETSGAGRSNANGGGGAGFATNGANGGSTAADGQGGAGGAAFAPSSRTYFAGGPKAVGGGGGGGLLLISCQDEVVIEGSIDAGGGGGSAGYDSRTVTAGTDLEGSGGGGAGGYVVLQGPRVTVTGTTSQLIANGGGGGGGCSADNCVGERGDDALSKNAAPGGTPSGGGGAGGAGGSSSSLPVNGRAGSSAGGGGGSVGVFEVYVPAGATPTLEPMNVSPNISPHGVIETR
ncbi:MAG: hypothetical protein SFX73_10465 [Kofleriaceae bacterium]|nr:hypothetical protein [Kofleriaceae bacterium]